MAIYFHRSVKLLPGLRLHLSKSGVGLSAGIRGFHVGVDGRRRPYVSAGIPGTGVSMRQYGKATRLPDDATPSGRGLLVALVIGFVLLILLAGSRR